MRIIAIIMAVLIIESCATLLGAHPFCKGAPKDYVMEPIRGTVADQETGEPIEGAIVVAFWKMPLQVVKVMESMTDAKGEYFFPGWGPIERNREGCFLEDDPLVKVFKPGYFALRLGNTYYGQPGRGGSPEDLMVNKVSSRIRMARHDGATLKLKPFVIGQEIEYTDAGNRPAKRNLTGQDWCHQLIEVRIDREFWKDAPSWLEAMRQEKRQYPNCTNPVPASPPWKSSSPC